MLLVLLVSLLLLFSPQSLKQFDAEKTNLEITKIPFFVCVKGVQLSRT